MFDLSLLETMLEECYSEQEKRCSELDVDVFEFNTTNEGRELVDLINHIYDMKITFGRFDHARQR